EPELRRSPGPVIHWRSNTHVESNVLTLAQSDLHFRDDVPVCPCTGFQLAIGQELYHRGPCTARWAIRHKHLSRGSSEEVSIGDLLRVCRQFKPCLNLKERRSGKILAECCERFESGDARSEALRLVA